MVSSDNTIIAFYAPWIFWLLHFTFSNLSSDEFFLPWSIFTKHVNLPGLFAGDVTMAKHIRRDIPVATNTSWGPPPGKKFHSPRVSPGDQPLTEEPVNSGYEIDCDCCFWGHFRSVNQIVARQQETNAFAIICRFWALAAFQVVTNLAFFAIQKFSKWYVRCSRVQKYMKFPRNPLCRINRYFRTTIKCLEKVSIIYFWIFHES